MPENAQAAAVINPPANELAELRAQLTEEKRKRIHAEVMKRGENKIPNDKIDLWVSKAMADEAGIYAMIDGMAEQSPANSQPVGHKVEIVCEGEIDRIQKMPTAKERAAAWRKNWEGIIADAINRDMRGEKLRAFNPHGTHSIMQPQASNTFSATCTTSFLLDGAITDLQNRWAPLVCFTRDFSQDPYKPLATHVLKEVTATGSAIQDPTNWEQGGDTIGAISVTMHQESKPFSVTNAQLNSGFRMQDLITINSAGIANIIIQRATAPITTTNFPTGAQVWSSANFGWSDMATLWGALKKSSIKNICLDGEYLAKIINNPTYFQPTGTGTNWSGFGWDNICLNTEWSGAGTNVVAFACNPQAVVCVAGIPLTPPSVPGNTLQESRATVPDVGITIAAYSWFALQSRTAWMSYDLMFGAAKGDATAGRVVTSA